MTSILLTKLFVPTPHAALVQRPRLVAKLNGGLSKRLTVVAAPAGFGKTTLVADWVAAQSSHKVVWISLSSAENSPATFLRYLLTGLHPIIPNAAESLQQQLQNSDTHDAIHLAAQLVNALATGAPPTILVLDDFHTIEDQLVHDAIAFLLAHAPPQLHTVITTRVDPPFQLARMRARGQLTEIRAADLRFTPSEAATFLNEQMQLGLDGLQLEQLLSRTEGWIASLQLAALALQSAPLSRTAFLNSFAGSDRYIVDYLVNEVLNEISAETRTFLFQTAHLDRFCAPLCDAVRSATDSDVQLRELERINLFLFPLDHQRYWYRYHHLFADLLRHRSEAEVDRRLLHQRASDWFAAQQLVDEAIEHAFSAENPTHAAALITQHAHPMFSSGKIEQVYRWVARLPQTWVATRPALFLLQALMLYRFGRFDDFFAHLATSPDAEQFTPTQQGEWLSIQAYAAYLRGDFQHGQQLCRNALAHIGNPMLKMPTLGLLGWFYQASGNIDNAIATLAQSVQLAERTGSLTGLLGGGGKLAMLHAMQGNWPQVKAQHVKTVAAATARHAQPIPLFGLTQLAIGQWHHALGDTATAVTVLKQGLALCKRWGGLHIDVLYGYAALLTVLAEGGNSAEWQKTRAEAQTFAIQSHTPKWAHAILNTTPPSKPTLAEPLTQREQDVLQLLGQGLKTPAIADQMIVSVSTVRTHIKRVYAKLDVHNRSDAITKARDLRLIP